MKLSERQQEALRLLSSHEGKLEVSYNEAGKAQYNIHWYAIWIWVSSPVHKATFQSLLQNQYIYEKEKDVYMITNLGRNALER